MCFFCLDWREGVCPTHDPAAGIRLLIENALGERYSAFSLCNILYSLRKEPRPRGVLGERFWLLQKSKLFMLSAHGLSNVSEVMNPLFSCFFGWNWTFFCFFFCLFFSVFLSVLNRYIWCPKRWTARPVAPPLSNVPFLGCFGLCPTNDRPTI